MENGRCFRMLHQSSSFFVSGEFYTPRVHTTWQKKKGDTLTWNWSGCALYFDLFLIISRAALRLAISPVLQHELLFSVTRPWSVRSARQGCSIEKRFMNEHAKGSFQLYIHEWYSFHVQSICLALQSVSCCLVYLATSISLCLLSPRHFLSPAEHRQNAFYRYRVFNAHNT